MFINYTLITDCIALLPAAATTYVNLFFYSFIHSFIHSTGFTLVVFILWFGYVDPLTVGRTYIDGRFMLSRVAHIRSVHVQCVLFSLYAVRHEHRRNLGGGAALSLYSDENIRKETKNSLYKSVF